MNFITIRVSYYENLKDDGNKKSQPKKRKVVSYI